MNTDQIPHVLACDVGNSAVHIAHVLGDEAQDVQHFRHGELAPLGEAMGGLWGQIPEPKKIVAASVNPTGLKAVEAAAVGSAGQDALVIGRDLPLPIETDLGQPASVGVDRLCNAVAAFDRLGMPCVIADFGTAITIDCVNAEGIFLGGAILPGLAAGAKALAQSTAQLPAVTPAEPDWVFGKETAQAIVGGLVFGARGALRELVEAYAGELGQWPLVILTGGDARLICPDVGASDLIQAVVPELPLLGVAAAYYRTLLQ